MNATTGTSPVPTPLKSPETKKQTKYCSACKTEHKIEAFALNGRQSRQSQCKLARRRYINAHYEKNRPAYIARVSARATGLRNQLYETLLALPRPSKCASCNKALPTKRSTTPRNRPVALLSNDLGSPSVNRLINDLVSMDRIEAAMDNELTWVHRSCIARLRTNIATL